MEHVTIHDDSMRLAAVLDNADSVGYKLVHNDLWTGTFSLPNDDPKNGYCQPGALVMIPDGNRATGLYRISGIPGANVTGLGELTTYDAEHVLATLLDDVIFGKVEWKDMTVTDAITALLDRQTVRRWALGTCEFDGTITVALENETLLSALRKICSLLPDEYTWTFDTTALPWVLNVKHADTNDGCGIHYARNLVEVQKTMDASQIVTRLYLMGGADSLGNPVRVNAVNDGQEYIDADTMADWGVRCAIYGDSRITRAEELLEKGRRVLETYKNPYYTYQATALDLHRVTGQSWDDFLPGKKVRVMDDEHGVRFSARIVSIEKRDVFGDPGGITVTIANAPRDQLNAVSILAEKVGDLDSASGTQAGEIIRQDKETKSSLQAAADELKARREDVEALTGRVTVAETALEITPDGISLMAERANDLYDDYAQILVKGGSIGMLASHMENVEGWITGTAASLELYGDRLETRVQQYEGRVVSAESAVKQYADELLFYVKSGDLNSSISLTGDGVTIQGGTITLTGYVKATELQTTTAEINNLKSGMSTFSLLSATFANIATLGATTGSIATLSVGSSATLPNPTTFGSTSMGVYTFTVDGTVLASFMGTQNINFNIADTQTYKDDVSAARQAGADSVYVQSVDAYDETYISSSKKLDVDLDIELSNGDTGSHTVSVDASDAYDEGYKAVGINRTDIRCTNTAANTFYVQVRAQNGSTQTRTFTINVGQK